MLEQRRKTTLSQKAYENLRDQIITLELGPGTQVNEGDIGRELSIGRTPVREALLRLVNEGFLGSTPGRGFFVCEVTIEVVRELFESVMILGRGSIALAALRISEIELCRLKEIHQSLKSAMCNGQYLEITLLNSQFHNIINQACRNDFLIGALYNLEPQYHRLAYLCFSEKAEFKDLEAHFSKVMADHEKLIESLINRDEKAAVNAITAHIGLFHSRVAQYLFPPMHAIEAASGSFSQNPEKRLTTPIRPGAKE